MDYPISSIRLSIIPGYTKKLFFDLIDIFCTATPYCPATFGTCSEENAFQRVHCRALTQSVPRDVFKLTMAWKMFGFMLSDVDNKTTFCQCGSAKAVACSANASNLLLYQKKHFTTNVIS